ncbi:MAG: hypothetical protein SFU86_25350 [Pirellulaceae bacterium]|nr:hypothetical protein [Pirellulaceae bacterium]
MTTATITPAQRDLREVIARLAGNKRDKDTMRQACDRMDRMREELRARIGNVDMAVDLIRDARNP